MKARALRSLGTTAVERAMGQQPGRTRAMTAAMFAGIATAAATYKLLRSGGGGGDEE